MKSAEELYEEFWVRKIFGDTSKESFTKIIKSHDSEIKQMIQEKIKLLTKEQEEEDYMKLDIAYSIGYNKALTELLKELEGK